MFNLLLTADYEIFGDGSGCVQSCLISPSEQLMKLCENVGMRMTFFVDVCEYWAFRETENKGLLPSNYRPATWIKNQLQDAVRRGHDVQLHCHPQWLDYDYVSPTQWKVNFKYWRLPYAQGGFGKTNNINSFSDFLSCGRDTLESLLKPINSEYECRAFRAGAWCLQPEDEILEAMEKINIWYDTTVAPGLSFDNGLTVYDFSRAPQNIAFWKVKRKIDVPNNDGNVFEIPISVRKVSLPERIFLRLLNRRSKFPLLPTDCTKQPSTSQNQSKNDKSILKKLKNKIGSHMKMFDFCSATTWELKKFLLSARKRFVLMSKSQMIPIVAIGHPKGFTNPEELRKLLVWANRKSWIELESLKEQSFWQKKPEKLYLG